ncbi:hypothetical protein T09_8982 [Trichinella sp. T9]|nr:hypothetical protein T09_8982 [Trichinella sp. T9]
MKANLEQMKNECICSKKQKIEIHSNGKERPYTKRLINYAEYNGCTFAALTNSMLFTAISMKASKKNADKFNLSSAVSGITYLCANIARMMNDCTVHLTTPWMCLIGHPQVTLFAVCEPASTAGMFLMALDCSITVVCFKPAKWSIMKKNVNCFIIITFSCIAVGVATMWIVVFFRTQTHVLACCYFEDVLPFHMYVANYRNTFSCFIHFTELEKN